MSKIRSRVHELRRLRVNTIFYNLSVKSTKVLYLKGKENGTVKEPHLPYSS